MEYRTDLDPVQKQIQMNLLNQLQQLLPQIPKSALQFRSGKDPIFVVKPGEPPRTAVTWPEPNSPVIFNLDVINDPELFDVKDAAGLLIHELGHKIRKNSQFEMDAFANDFAEASRFRQHRVFSKNHGAWMVVVNWPLSWRYAESSVSGHDSIERRFYGDPEPEIRPTVALVKESGSYIDISDQVFPRTMQNPNRFSGIGEYYQVGQSILELIDRSFDGRERFGAVLRYLRLNVRTNSYSVAATGEGREEISFEVLPKVKESDPVRVEKQKSLLRPAEFTSDVLQLTGDVKRIDGEWVFEGNMEMDTLRSRHFFPMHRPFFLGTFKLYVRINDDERAIDLNFENRDLVKLTYGEEKNTEQITKQKIGIRVALPKSLVGQAESVEAVGLQSEIFNRSGFDWSNRDNLYFVPLRFTESSSAESARGLMARPSSSGDRVPDRKVLPVRSCKSVFLSFY